MKTKYVVNKFTCKNLQVGGKGKRAQIVLVADFVVFFMFSSSFTLVFGIC